MTGILAGQIAALRRLFATARMFVMAFGLFSMTTATPAQDLKTLESRQQEGVREQQLLEHELTLSKERQEKLDAEIAALKKDSVTLTAALIQAAKTERKLAQDIEDIETRLATLSEQDVAIQLSLLARRKLLAEVLAALQRMGLNPPPAILVTPEDALSSVRSAILLGAVVPEIRSETSILLADLRELSRVHTSISAERDRLSATVSEQVEEKQRLGLLLNEKRQLQAKSEKTRATEQKRSERLAEQAGSLQELIASLESEITGIRDAAAKAQAETERTRRAVLKARNAEEMRLAEGRKRAEDLSPEASRIAPSTPFSAMRGKLVLPVTGRIVQPFGSDRNVTGRASGDTVATQSGAIVTAPSDGIVLYAGRFRSYGQLLILDVRDGYHVVLAGMGRINVELGQSVLAGEPIGAMGEARLASAANFESSNNRPALYIEFRKDGKPIDPAPWWSATISGRTGNDT